MTDEERNDMRESWMAHQINEVLRSYRTEYLPTACPTQKERIEEGPSETVALREIAVRLLITTVTTDALYLMGQGYDEAEAKSAAANGVIQDLGRDVRDAIDHTFGEVAELVVAAHAESAEGETKQ